MMLFLCAVFFVFFVFVKEIESAGHVASFTAEKTGVVGTIYVEKGQIAIDLDFTNLDKSKLPMPTCFDNGIKYHMHTMWTYNDGSLEKIGSAECGASWTGGHWDPWNACGPATGSLVCKANTGCLPSSEYMCNTTNYWKNPYVCEVGDWSGKYGVLMIDSTTQKVSNKVGSFWEVTDADLEQSFSVVLHCGTAAAERALCAKFVPATMANDKILNYQPKQSTNNQNGNDVAKVTFGTNSANYVQLSTDGSVSVNFDLTDYQSYLANMTCTNLRYGIFNEWMDKTQSYLWGHTNCMNNIGMLYDPTNACYNIESDSDKCYGMMDLLCNDTNYMYNCDPMKRYSCSPTDLSGKYGTIDISNNNRKFNKNIMDYSFPNSDMIAGKSVAIYCANSMSNQYLACASLQFIINDSTNSLFNANFYYFYTALFAMVIKLTFF